MLGELDAEAADVPHVTRPVFLLKAKHGGPESDDASAERASFFEATLAALHERDPAAHARTMEELAYLTNVLVSGGTVDGRSFRLFEAVVTVAEVCNLGLEELTKVGKIGKHSRTSDARGERALELLREGADKVFRVGFWLLDQRGGFTRSPRARAPARSR